MEAVLRCEYGTERQVIEICEIDLMALLYVPQQLCLDYKRKENVDREHEREVGKIVADRGFALFRPFPTDIRCRLRNIEQLEPESYQPFGIHVVDDRIGHLLGVFRS